jgi:hypothetical protein
MGVYVFVWGGLLSKCVSMSIEREPEPAGSEKAAAV